MLRGLVHLWRRSPRTLGGLVLVDRSHRTVFPRLADQYGDALKANNGDDYFGRATTTSPTLLLRRPQET